MNAVLSHFSAVSKHLYLSRYAFGTKNIRWKKLMPLVDVTESALCMHNPIPYAIMLRH